MLASALAAYSLRFLGGCVRFEGAEATAIRERQRGIKLRWLLLACEADDLSQPQIGRPNLLLRRGRLELKSALMFLHKMVFSRGLLKDYHDMTITIWSQQEGVISTLAAAQCFFYDVACRRSSSLCSGGVSVVTVKAVARSGSMGRIS